MKCPKCAAECADDAAECASCGLVFSKWRELKEKERLEAQAALARMDAPEPAAPPRDPWTARAVAIAIVLAWMAALAIYFLNWSRGRAPAQ